MNKPLCSPNAVQLQRGGPDCPLTLARAACVGCGHSAPGYCIPVMSHRSGWGMHLFMCSTTTSSPVLFCQARVHGHILLLWLLLPLLDVSACRKPTQCPCCILSAGPLFGYRCRKVVCMTKWSACLAVVKSLTAMPCCAFHLFLLLWLQLQELEVYADLLPFLAVRGFAFMRSQQLLEVYYSYPEEERDKGLRAAELVPEYNAWQVVLAENPSKKRQASSGDCSVV